MADEHGKPLTARDQLGRRLLKHGERPMMPRNPETSRRVAELTEGVGSQASIEKDVRRSAEPAHQKGYESDLIDEPPDPAHPGSTVGE